MPGPQLIVVGPFKAGEAASAFKRPAESEMVDVVPEKSSNSDFGAVCMTVAEMEGPRVAPRLASSSAATGVGVRVRQ